MDFPTLSIILNGVIVLLIVVLLVYWLCFQTDYCQQLRYTILSFPGLRWVHQNRPIVPASKFVERMPLFDSTLAYLVRQSPNQIRAIRTGEWAENAAIFQAVQTLEEEKSTASPPRLQEIEREIAQLAEAFPDPLTVGVYEVDQLPLTNEQKRQYKGWLMFSVFIDTQLSDQDLAAQGVIVRSRALTIVTAYASSMALERVSGNTFTRTIEKASAFFPALNRAMQHHGVEAVQTAPIVPPLSQAIEGEGVIIGIIDEFSIDYYHGDLLNPADGKTRFVSIWDQSLVPNASEKAPDIGPGFSPSPVYGVEYLSAQLNQDLAAYALPAKDPYQRARHFPDPVTAGSLADPSHPTSVAAAAASNGSLTSRPGPAKKADLIYVRADHSRRDTSSPSSSFVHILDNTYVADGFAYIFKKAKELGKPCIVNMSMSMNMGAHNGSSASERYLDNLLSKSQRIVTLPSGNGNNKAEFSTRRVPISENLEIGLQFENNATSSQYLEFWMQNTVFVSCEIEFPSEGTTLTVRATDPVQVTALSDGTPVHAFFRTNVPHTDANCISIFIFPAPSFASIKSGDWKFTFSPDPSFPTPISEYQLFAWSSRSNRGRRRWVPAIENQYSVSIPATANRALTVGAVQLPDKDAAVSASNYFEHAPFSGCGPTRVGATKPDLTALGVALSLAKRRVLSSGGTSHSASDRHTVEGTSYAAPIVAGACALLFDCWKQLCGAVTNMNHQVVRELLIGQVFPAPAMTPPTEEYLFGNGILRLDSLCPPPIPQTDLFIRSHPQDEGYEPFTNKIFWKSPDIEVIDPSTLAPIKWPYTQLLVGVYYTINVTIHNRNNTPVRDAWVALYWFNEVSRFPYFGKWIQKGIITTGKKNPLYAGEIGIGVDTVPANGSITVTFRLSSQVLLNLQSNVLKLRARVDVEGDRAPLISSDPWRSNNIAARNYYHRRFVRPFVRVPEFFFKKIGPPTELSIETENIEGEISLTVPNANIDWRASAMLKDRIPDNKNALLQALSDLKALAFWQNRSRYFKQFASFQQPEFTYTPSPHKVSAPPSSQALPTSQTTSTLSKEERAIVASKDPVEIFDLTGIENVVRMEVTAQFTTLTFKAKEELYFGSLLMEEEQPLPMEVSLDRARFTEDMGEIHFFQTSAGKAVDGFTLSLEPEK